MYSNIFVIKPFLFSVFFFPAFWCLVLDHCAVKEVHETAESLLCDVRLLSLVHNLFLFKNLVIMQSFFFFVIYSIVEMDDKLAWDSMWTGKESDLNVSASDFEVCCPSRLYQSSFHKFKTLKNLPLIFKTEKKTIQFWARCWSFSLKRIFAYNEMNSVQEHWLVLNISIEISVMFLYYRIAEMRSKAHRDKHTEETKQTQQNVS